MLRCRGHQLYPGRVSESVCEESAVAATTASTAAVVAALASGIGCPRRCRMLMQGPPLCNYRPVVSAGDNADAQ